MAQEEKLKHFQDNSRLWTIQDAKIGDILTASDGSIFIYAGLKGTLAQSYIALLADGDLNTMKCNWEEKTSVSPATKEQHDLLFAKMKEAGYEWDADKKELRKIKKLNEKDMTKEELKEILECDEIRDTWEYVQEFVEKFGKIPEDQDELVVCVNYVLECMQGNHQNSTTDEWQVAEGLYKCTKRMFDGTPEGKILFEVGEVYKCLSKHDIAEFEVSYGHSVFLIDPVVRKHFIPLGENK